MASRPAWPRTNEHRDQTRRPPFRPRPAPWRSPSAALNALACPWRWHSPPRLPSRRRAPRPSRSASRPAAGQGAAAIRPADPAAGLFPARSGARPEGARRLGLADRAAGAGPPAGRFRPGGPHRRQHRRHRARARRNRDAVRRAGVRRRPRRSRRGPGRAPQPHRHQDRHAAQRDSADHQRGHRAAAGDDRRDRHQPGAALHPGFSSYGSENRSDWYSVLRGFTPRPMWTGCRCPRP